MAVINLHNILCHLTGDDNFLSTIIETNDKDFEQKKNKQKGFNLMANMVTEYIPLSPYELQNYAMFPHNVKSFLTPDYVRLGIKNVMEKNLNIVNISFLNSFNMLLRPDLYKANIDDHIRNLILLETFICHKIQRNYQIDKTKNTSKVKIANRELIKNLSEGKISHDLIQHIINIFEINLMVFDLTKMEINLYWAKGHKYPFFNPFKNIYCMSYVQGNYEPVMPPDHDISEEQRRKMYTKILINLPEIKCFPEISLALHTLEYINSWEIDPEAFIKIVEIFEKNPRKKCIDEYDALVKLEGKTPPVDSDEN